MARVRSPMAQDVQIEAANVGMMYPACNVSHILGDVKVKTPTEVE